MKKFLLFFLFPVFAIIAQHSSISGKVINEKAVPIYGASILIIGTTQGTSANESGYFEIKNLLNGYYDLQISAVGYEKKILSRIKINYSDEELTVVLTEEPIRGEQVIVSAGKYEQKIRDLTVSTVVLQPEMISKKNYLTFDDMLRYVPGIQMNLEQVSIRGSSGYSKGAGARVLTAINGLPIYSGDNGDIVWEMIPMADIERVEIIKGPASSLYGSTAIGGVINIITRNAVKRPITNFKTYFGVYDKPSYDIWNWSDSHRPYYGIELTHSNSIKNLGYTFSLKKFDNNSYRQNDFTKRYLGYLKLNYAFNENDYLTFFGNYLNMNRGNFLYWKDSRNALVPKDEDNGNTVQSNRLFTGLIYHHHFSDDFNLDLKGSYYRTKFTGYGIEITNSTADLIRGEAIANLHVNENLILTTGAEGSYSNISSNIFRSPTFAGGAGYMQIEFRGIPNMITTVGVRYDYIKLDTLNGKNALTPRFGLNYKLSTEFILRASAGTGFRAPTPSEVFTSADVGGGVSVKENPNLTSETSLSFELGANYKPSSDVSWDAAFYQTDYNNFIEPNLLKDGSIQFLNLTKARIQGLEVTTDWWILPGTWKFSAGYNYMWARDIENNKAMKYRPLNSVNAQLRYLPSPFEFGIDFRYMSEVEEIDFALAEPPLALVVDGERRVPVYVTDLLVGYNFLISSIPAKIYLNAKNIFNYNYVEFIGNIAPIRNYSASFEIFF
jgi:outer membrane receptor for ferrienterochelin and colicins